MSNQKNYSNSIPDLLSYFSANAPVDIPNWFNHKKPDDSWITPMPDIKTIKTERERIIAQDIIWGDKEYIPENLAWVDVQHSNHLKDLEKWNKENEAERFFQWRVHFAKTMVKMLNNE